MSNQLHLLELGEEPWILDDRTREAGLRGLADARRALAEAVRRATSESQAA